MKGTSLKEMCGGGGEESRWSPDSKTKDLFKYLNITYLNYILIYKYLLKKKKTCLWNNNNLKTTKRDLDVFQSGSEITVHILAKWKASTIRVFFFQDNFVNSTLLN